jgi:hypothetical protein
MTRWVTVALLVLVVGFCACRNVETWYVVDEKGKPVVYMKQENFMRVGQGIVNVKVTNEETTISQLASEDAMSEMLQKSWANLNRTAQLIAIGSALGSAVGQPAAGGVAGGLAAQIEKMLKRNGEETSSPSDGLVFETIVPATP